MEVSQVKGVVFVTLELDETEVESLESLEEPALSKLVKERLSKFIGAELISGLVYELGKGKMQVALRI
ncbi:MAG: hypothetical protein HYY09_05520 [Firmicutes bacterium]|nr:hypothetical protein [Bacillota bacterium]